MIISVGLQYKTDISSHNKMKCRSMHFIKHVEIHWRHNKISDLYKSCTREVQASDHSFNKVNVIYVQFMTTICQKALIIFQATLNAQQASCSLLWIATNDHIAWCVAVCLSSSCTMHKRLNRSRCCFVWRLLRTKGTVYLMVSWSTYGKAEVVGGHHKVLEHCYSDSMWPSPNYFGILL